MTDNDAMTSSPTTTEATDAQGQIPPNASPPVSSSPKALGHVAIRGIFWTVAQSLGTKTVTVLQQILIARLFLSDEDFGRLAVVQVVASIASLGQSTGVGEMLVRRHRRFARWVDAGFWMNVTGGLAGMLLVLGLVPVWSPVFLGVARLFGGHVVQAPEVRGLLAVMALWLPLDSMMAVMNARLRIDMRFKALAFLGTLQTAGMAILSLALAALKFGAYSLVIPQPVFSAVVLVTAWLLTRQRIRMHLDLRRWRVLFRDSRYFLAGNICSVFVLNGDYMVASVFFPQATLGAYYFAYRMSTQTAQLIGANMMSVLLPSFSKIDDDERRRTLAYERTCACLQLIGVPLCFLQALVADDAFHLVFGTKWNAALPLFKLLSVGMAMVLPMTAAGSLLLSQGRYRLNLMWASILAVSFLGFVLAGALCGSVFTVACFVAAFLSITGPMTVAVPVWNQGALGFLWRVYSFPVLAGGAAACAGWGLGWLIPWKGIWPGLAFHTVGCLATFALIVAVVRPRAARELAQRLGPLLRRR